MLREAEQRGIAPEAAVAIASAILRDKAARRRLPDDGFAAYEKRRTGKTNGSAAPALWIDTDTWQEADIPRRPWVVPGYALRGAVTVVAGPPSVMKSSLMLAWACAIALCVEYGDFRPRAQGKAAVYNIEDDRDEQRRRLSATLRQFDAVPGDVHNSVIRAGDPGREVVRGQSRHRPAARNRDDGCSPRALTRARAGRAYRRSAGRAAHRTGER